jgi:hypothetical protein
MKTRQLFRLIAVLVTTTALALVGSTVNSAFADGPKREPVPASDFSLPPGPCPFPLDFHIVTNQEYSLTYTDQNGNPTHEIVTGLLVVQVTNHDSGASIERNISGPGDYRFNPDGTITLSAWGTWLLFFFPGQLGPGAPGMVIINNGFVELLTNPDGTQTILSRSGSLEDVCATLS